MTQAIIGKFYNDLPSAIKELERQNKDFYLKRRRPVIMKFKKGYLIVVKNIMEKCQS